VRDDMSSLARVRQIRRVAKVYSHGRTAPPGSVV
jgi:hypothetical protein